MSLRIPEFFRGEKLSARRLNDAIDARVVGHAGSGLSESLRYNDESILRLNIEQFLQRLPHHICRFKVNSLHLADGYADCITWDGTSSGTSIIKVALWDTTTEIEIEIGDTLYAIRAVGGTAVENCEWVYMPEDENAACEVDDIIYAVRPVCVPGVGAEWKRLTTDRLDYNEDDIIYAVRPVGGTYVENTEWISTDFALPAPYCLTLCVADPTTYGWQPCIQQAGSALVGEFHFVDGWNCAGPMQPMSGWCIHWLRFGEETTVTYKVEGNMFPIQPTECQAAIARWVNDGWVIKAVIQCVYGPDCIGQDKSDEHQEVLGKGAYCFLFGCGQTADAASQGMIHEFTLSWIPPDDCPASDSDPCGNCDYHFTTCTSCDCDCAGCDPECPCDVACDVECPCELFCPCDVMVDCPTDLPCPCDMPLCDLDCPCEGFCPYDCICEVPCFYDCWCGVWCDGE